MLASAEAMLRTVKLRAVEASTVTAAARDARDGARKLVSPAVALKPVSSDWRGQGQAEGHACGLPGGGGEGGEEVGEADAGQG